MSEVTAFVTHQSIIGKAALYAGFLLFLLFAGGVALTLLVRALDRIGEAITLDRDWQTHGSISKEETLLLISVLLYAKLLLSIEPPLRAFASVMGDGLLASLVLAPIAGAVLYGMRATRQATT
jgi:hypothetical protein